LRLQILNGSLSWEPFLFVRACGLEDREPRLRGKYFERHAPQHRIAVLVQCG